MNTINARRLLLIVSVSFSLLGAAAIVPTAQQECNQAFVIAARNQFYNVRVTPLVQSSILLVRTVVRGTLEPASNLIRSSDGHDWYKLCNGGYAQDSVVVTVSVTASPTSSPTPTKTSTPAILVTPTRIRHNFIWCKRDSVTQTVASDQTFVECSAP